MARGQQSDEEEEEEMGQKGRLGPDLGPWRLEGAAGSHQRLYQRASNRGMTRSNMHFKKIHLAAVRRMTGVGQSKGAQWVWRGR